MVYKYFIDYLSPKTAIHQEPALPPPAPAPEPALPSGPFDIVFPSGSVKAMLTSFVDPNTKNFVPLILDPRSASKMKEKMQEIFDVSKGVSKEIFVIISSDGEYALQTPYNFSKIKSALIGKTSTEQDRDITHIPLSMLCKNAPENGTIIAPELSDHYQAMQRSCLLLEECKRLTSIHKLSITETNRKI